MAHVQHNAKLNQLLIDMSRSLLQYAGLSSLWSSRKEASVEQEFAQLVDLQEKHVASITDLLMDRGWTIDFGGFPAAYTDLHFVSLKYLLKQIIQNQAAVTAELDEAAHTCVDDPEAASLLNLVLASERQILERLQALSGNAVAA